MAKDELKSLAGLDDDDLLKYEALASHLDINVRQVYRLVRGELGQAPIPIRRVGWAPRVRVGDYRQWVRQL